MVRITESLVRRRAEHNELEISTLEEVSLHQQDIEKIEYLDKWCRELRILYLQSNLIEKIENVSRLKKLEYLNLALNNVEKIENLENCESLEKLDLTVNFVGELTSIENLKALEFFKELYLTGNPCTDFEGYKEYVIATLPRLERLDGIEIEKSERIKAVQNYESVKKSIIRQENEYLEKRCKEREAEERKKQRTLEKKPGFDGRWYTDIHPDSTSGDITPQLEEVKEETIAPGDAKDKAFWDEAVPYTPESRKEVHAHMKKLKEQNEKKTDPKQEKRTRRYFSDDGRPMNVNEAKVEFKFEDNERTGCYVLDLAVFKHMDTSLMDADVHPHYVRVVLKDKVFQLCLDQEVIADKSTAQRSQTTGHLVITMPKLKPETVHYQSKPADKTLQERSKQSQLLEVDPSNHSSPDFGNIYNDKKKEKVEPLFAKKEMNKPRENSENFVDDPDVPPLI